MGRRTYSPEFVVNKPEKAKVLLSQASTVWEASEKIEVTAQTHYRWRREYGDVRLSKQEG